MTISLEDVIPITLKDKLKNRPSDIWNASVRLNAGEWIKIKSPSGSGKTTLVHILWQLRTDYEGSITYGTLRAPGIGGDELSLFRQRELSVVFQDLRLFGQLSARENIELKRVMYGKPLYDANAIDEMATRLGVSHILGQQAALCSYGEQQRVAIIRALMQPFSWLIMDEPFSHLDNANIVKAAALIAEECSKRNAGILITDLEADGYFKYSRQLEL